MKRHLFVLLGCPFVVMIGFGITLPVLPYYVERLADWRTLVKTLSPLLALTLAGQFALTMFEGTFALFAQAKLDFGPAEVGDVLVVCGLVMTVFQAGAVGFPACKISEMIQIGAGESVEEALHKLHEHRATGLPVVAKARGCYGTVSMHSLDGS